MPPPIAESPLSIQALPAPEHLAVAQICLNKFGAQEGFHQITDVIIIKTNRTTPTEIFINGSLSAQNCMAFSEVFILTEVSVL